MIVQRDQWQDEKASLTARRDWAGSGRLMSDDVSKRMVWCFPFTQHGEKNDGPMSKVSIRIIDWFSRKRTCLSDSVRDSQRLIKYCAEEMIDSLMTFIKSPPPNYSSCPIAWVCEGVVVVLMLVIRIMMVLTGSHYSISDSLLWPIDGCIDHIESIEHDRQLRDSTDPLPMADFDGEWDLTATTSETRTASSILRQSVIAHKNRWSWSVSSNTRLITNGMCCHGFFHMKGGTHRRRSESIRLNTMNKVLHDPMNYRLRVVPPEYFIWCFSHSATLAIRPGDDHPTSVVRSIFQWFCPRQKT